MLLLSLGWLAPLAAAESDSEQLMLKVGDQEVSSLYRHAQSSRLDGGVILLHDQGAHPDWPGVIQTLRRELPRYGWSTLSLELAALDGSDKPALEQLFDSTPARIEAAIVAMGERNISNLVVIGHGVGATVAADYIVKKSSEQFQGLIAIGMDGSPAADEAFDGAHLLRKLKTRIYDIYGGRDLATVVKSADRREQTVISSAKPDQKSTHLRAIDVAKNFNQENAKQISYRQLRIEGADHQFWGYEKLLLSRVVGWLRRYAASTDIKISR